MPGHCEHLQDCRGRPLPSCMEEPAFGFTGTWKGGAWESFYKRACVLIYHIWKLPCLPVDAAGGRLGFSAPAACCKASACFSTWKTWAMRRYVLGAGTEYQSRAPVYEDTADLRLPLPNAAARCDRAALLCLLHHQPDCAGLPLPLDFILPYVLQTVSFLRNSSLSDVHCRWPEPSYQTGAAPEEGSGARCACLLRLAPAAGLSLDSGTSVLCTFSLNTCTCTPPWQGGWSWKALQEG